MRKSNRDKYIKILQEYNSGLSICKIAKKHGVSRQRIGQIFLDFNEYQARPKKIDIDIKTVKELLVRGTSIDTISKFIGASKTVIYKRLKEEGIKVDTHCNRKLEANKDIILKDYLEGKYNLIQLKQKYNVSGIKISESLKKWLGTDKLSKGVR